jgi:hypothetical protein
MVGVKCQSVFAVVFIHIFFFIQLLCNHALAMSKSAVSAAMTPHESPHISSNHANTVAYMY